jgi:tetratricopeptide (TPR) repeat protein
MNPLKRLKAAFFAARGEKAFSRGDGGRALDYLERAMKHGPDDPRNAALYALALAASGQPEKGLDRLSAAEKEQAHPLIYFFRARILLDLEQYGDALEAAETAVSLDGDNKLARSYLALIKLYLNRDTRASLGAIRHSLPFVNSEFAARFLLFCSYYLSKASGVYPAAISDRTAVSELLEEPLPDEGRIAPSLSLRFSRAWRLMLNPFLRFLFPAGRKRYALRVRGAFSFYSGDHAAALGFYREILSHHADDAEAAYGMVLIHFLRGDFASAEAGMRCSALFEQLDEWPELRKLAGMAAFRRGRYGDALTYLAPAKKSGEMTHLSHYFTALCRLNLGAPKAEVLRHLRQAAEKEWRLVPLSLEALAGHYAKISG